MLIPNDKNIPIVHHSLELKTRSLYILLSILLNFFTCYFYSEQLCALLASPLLKLDLGKDIGFIYTNLTEAFFSYLKVSAFTTILMTIPFILIQLWMFIVPGLYRTERKKVTIIIIIFLLLVFLGLYIAYSFILPIAWKFFLSFETENKDFLSVQLQPKMDQYMTLALNILITLGISFHLPMYLYFIIELNIISYEWFVLRRNISCVVMFILAAIVSPPDVLSQILIVIPLFFLYELVLFLVFLNKEYSSIKSSD